MNHRARAAWFGALLVLATLDASAASASDRFCDRTTPLTATQQDRLLRFADIVKQTLDAAGTSVALVSRSGLDLERFRIRYSHAGLSLRASANGPWSVRQLYYACDEGKPRLFDQGMAGFVSGTDDVSLGYVSIVLLPATPDTNALERAALDNARALRLIAGRYSANAHPFSLRYQNCNQWVIEMIASAWGGLDDGDALRARAQQWLREQAYAPASVDAGSHWLMLVGAFVPWLHFDDRPDDERHGLTIRTSLPSSIEAFVRARVPRAERIELCHDKTRIVVRQGWTPIEAGCVPAPGDRVITFDAAG